MKIKSVQYPCQCAIATTDDGKPEKVMCVIPCETHALKLQKELMTLAKAVRRLHPKKKENSLE